MLPRLQPCIQGPRPYFVDCVVAAAAVCDGGCHHTVHVHVQVHVHVHVQTLSLSHTRAHARTCALVRVLAAPATRARLTTA